MKRNEDLSLQSMRHSLAHITASAVARIWPQAKFGVGPVIDNGYYYDIDLGEETISEDDFPKIEAVMKEIVKAAQPFVKIILPIDEAISWAEKNNQPYKRELLNDLKRAGTTAFKDLDANELGKEAQDEGKSNEVSFYQNGDFFDLCRGPHVGNTKDVGAFKLIKVAGAYWRGKESNPQMQRLYGVAFPTQKELDEYLTRVEEAKNRDHRKLGKELDLFTFSELVGPGLPLFTPRGTIVRNQLRSLLLQVGREFGGQEVSIPHIAKRKLYEISGHAQKFNEELFEVKSHYDIDFVMKPVNCPHHTQIFASQPRSYRDLPISYMESTIQYRDEKPGQIGGLTRVRAITVDDGHVFCRVDQIKEVVRGLCDFIQKFHSSLGMYGDHWVSLSVRDPQNPDAYIGDTKDWDSAEQMLEKLAEESHLNARRMEGEAALYGPKLDFMYKDVAGNERQLSTIQLDFATPKRFNLTYVDEKGGDQFPVMIHRAILGSYERFLAILLEKTTGRLPFWLAPEQIRILTINETTAEYTKKLENILKETVVMKPLKYNELRYTVDDRNESLSRKIKDANTMKIPVVFIVGPRDMENNEVSVRVDNKESKVLMSEVHQLIMNL